VVAARAAQERGKRLRQLSLKKLLKKVIKPLVAVVASVITYGAVSGFLFTAATASTAASGALAAAVASGTISATTASIAAGAVAGAASGIVGQVVATGSTDDLGKAALSGAVFGAIGGYYGNTQSIGRVVTTTVAGGVVAEVNGGEFRDGALVAGAQSLARLGYDKMREFTDDMGYKAAGGDPARLQVDSLGSLRTDGKTSIETGGPSFFGERIDRLASGVESVVGKLGMSEQGKGTHWYDAPWIGGPNGPVASFVNQVSKAHDWWNGWNYNHATGAYVSRGAAFDTMFDVGWNFPGMLPMAGYTAAALSPATSHLYLSERDRSRQNSMHHQSSTTPSTEPVFGGRAGFGIPPFDP
jgi:hypothetical protein